MLDPFAQPDEKLDVTADGILRAREVDGDEVTEIPSELFASQLGLNGMEQVLPRGFHMDDEELERARLLRLVVEVARKQCFLLGYR